MLKPEPALPRPAMPEGQAASFPSITWLDLGHRLTIIDGATADPLPHGRSARAVNRGPRVAMDAGVLESIFGDTTEDTDLEDADAGEQTPELAEDANPPAHEVEPPALNFGWGIVVGELTSDDFIEIMSMPKL